MEIRATMIDDCSKNVPRFQIYKVSCSEDRQKDPTDPLGGNHQLHCGSKLV